MPKLQVSPTRHCMPYIPCRLLIQARIRLDQLKVTGCSNGRSNVTTSPQSNKKLPGLMEHYPTSPMLLRPAHKDTDSNTERKYAAHHGPLVAHSRTLLRARFLVHAQRQRPATDLSGIPLASQVTRTIRELGREGGEVGRAVAFPVQDTASARSSGTSSPAISAEAQAEQRAVGDG